MAKTVDEDGKVTEWAFGEAGKVDDVQVDGTSVIADKIAILQSAKAELIDTSAEVWTAAQQKAARERIGIVVCTQTEYDALTDKSGLHIIVEE